MSDPLRESYVAALEAENDMLRNRVRDLEREFGFYNEVPIIFRLTPTEGKIMSLLGSRDSATFAQLMSAILADRLPGKEPESDIVKVFVCKIRKKVKPFGIDIATLWGRGYRLAPEMKAKVSEYLTAQSQMPEAAE